MKTTPKATAPDSRKEGTMSDNKLTILYERLSHEDGRENESLSIEHQKEYLEEYAARNGFTNVVHRTDDGWSGTRWDRPGFLQIMEDIERGNVGQILIKDMSRLGRDHLRVGLFLEQLRERGVRLIAVAEGIDTAKGEDDFMPFRNIFAEWHARDTSRKIRAIFGARTAAGKHVTGALPYGYLHDPDDRQKWILDEEAAPVVKRIFQGVIEGKPLARIAEELTAERILTPAAHWRAIGERVSMGASGADPYKWATATLIQILKKEEYMGWTVLNKTATESYKSKKREATPQENRLIFKDAHPAIVDEETWNVVQRLRETKRVKERIGGEPNPLTGYDNEQKTLDGEIERLQAEIDRYNTDSVRADKFIELVKRHTEFTEFSASLLNEFVEKIIVHEATKVNGVREQEVEIYLNFIGKFDLPEQEEQPEETPVRKSRKKRRHEMTEEQRAALRERDKVRYARKVAARKAAEEAQRAAILKGTAYEIRPQEAGAAHAAI